MKRAHSSDFSEEGTSGSEYSPDDSFSSEEGVDLNNRRNVQPKKNTARKNRPAKKECSFEKNCYRKNPDHFREFDHSHLKKILAEYSGSGDYNIPSDLQFQKHIVEQQLDILKNYAIYPINRNPNKKPKEESTDNLQSSSSSSQTSSIVQKNKNNPSKAGPPNKKNMESTQNKKPKEESTDNLESSSSSSQTSSNVKKEENNLSNAGPSNKKNMESTQNIPTSSNKNPSINSTTKQEKSVEINNKESSSNKQPPKRKIEEFFNVVAPKGKMKEKHEKAAPYYMFFTTITDSPKTHNHPLSITFQELLDPSLGNLKSSLQINFMIDLGWLLAQYYFAGYNEKPLTLLYGEESDDLAVIKQKKSNVDAHKVPMKNAFGKHHTKMSILHYEDGSIRLVISTANLYIDDWENRTQGLWLSPACYPLPNPLDVASGESPTGFKRSLINYLTSYSMPCLSPYLQIVKSTDFSHINVFFVASIPGGHFDTQWGLSCMSNLLSKHCVIPQNESSEWTLITQASSIGSYGANPNLWLCGDFKSSFCRFTNKSPMMTKQPELKLIYPSLNNVKNSHDNLLGGGCLPYSNSVHKNQPWLNEYLQEWSAVHSERNRAMPHIKSYLRLSPDATKAAFFLLTSANISKSAWGTFNKGNRALRINSYEVGVLFLPKFVNNQDYFSVELSDPNRLPVPYDLPPIPYESGETPWVMDYLS